MVDPEVGAAGAVLALDADGDAAGARADLVARGGRGDAPVGPGVAADGAEAGRAVKELDAGLDPLAGGGLVVGACVAEDEEDAGLVELARVAGGEGEGCGEEFGGGVLGVRAVGCWVSSI